jgi:hypothetical protein
MIVEVSRCTVDMLNQKMKIKTQDVGKKYAVRLYGLKVLLAIFTKSLISLYIPFTFLS